MTIDGTQGNSQNISNIPAGEVFSGTSLVLPSNRSVSGENQSSNVTSAPTTSKKFQRIGGKSFQFPLNLTSNYEDFLSIKTFDFIPYEPELRTVSRESNPADSDTESGESSDITIPIIRREATGNVEKRFIKNVQNTVYLPMPNDIRFTDGQTWESQNVGVVNYFGGELIKNVANMEGGGFAETVKIMAEGMASEFALNRINETGLVNTNFITQQSASKIINPYREQVFSGVQMRGFGFTYKFVPESVKERESLQNIIKILRQDSLPTTEASNSIVDDIFDQETEGDSSELREAQREFESGLQDRWFGVPRLFQLTFMTVNDSGSLERLKTLPKIKPCICKSVAVNYTPENVWATRLDKHAIAVEVSLDFEETEIVVAQDIEEGY